MKIKYAEDGVEYTKWDYDCQKMLFKLSDIRDENILLYYPVLDIQEEYEMNHFKLVFLCNERVDCTENSIYQVLVKDAGSRKRIGWLFPIQALLSKEHDYVDNIHFLKYAFVATCLLINKIDVCKEGNSDGYFRLQDYYDSSINLLVLDERNCAQIEGFNLDNYVISLYAKGYSYTGKGNICSKIEKIDNNLLLQRQPRCLDEISYIIHLIKYTIPMEREEFARFYTYYQIVEILIARVFEFEFNKIVHDLSNDAVNLLDRREELLGLANEKSRVKKLISQYSSQTIETKRLFNESCKALLNKQSQKISEDMAENLYAVRCLLVHRLYILDNQSLELLKEINIFFLDLLLESLLSLNFD